MNKFHVAGVDAISLFGPLNKALLDERDAEAARLRAQADEIEALSAEEYLGRGIATGTLESDGLAGRLAKAGWVRLEYMGDKPGWRVHGDHYERYVSRDDVIQALGDGAVPGAPDPE
jgi:hypothetical protein